jgi:chromosome transmission fidelity protein 4
LEEVAVRSNLAVEHKNFLNDFMSNYGSADTQAMEMEYDEICAQVDKITLKLFFKMIEVSKLEAALDLVNRLHLEQSFEIAMTAADRSNYRKLSDRIFTMREQRFNSNQDDDFSDDDDQGSYDGSITTFSRESNIVDTRRVKVSPEAPLSKQKMKHQDESSPKPKSRKRINPFATNTKKSPGKKPLMKSAKKEPTLSRMSTFSAESRRISKASKEII